MEKNSANHREGATGRIVLPSTQCFAPISEVIVKNQAAPVELGDLGASALPDQLVEGRPRDADVATGLVDTVGVHVGSLRFAAVGRCSPRKWLKLIWMRSQIIVRYSLTRNFSIGQTNAPTPAERPDGRQALARCSECFGIESHPRGRRRHCFHFAAVEQDISGSGRPEVGCRRN